MKSNRNQVLRRTEASFFNTDDGKELPVAFNVSCMNYCSLRVKKKFIDRYFTSKQVSQNCRTNQQTFKEKNNNQQRIQNKNPFAVSPIKIYDNSPVLLRQRIKTEYPKVRIFRQQRKDNMKSVYKAVTIQFLEQKDVNQAKKNKIKINRMKSLKKQTELEDLNRPMTTNSRMKKNKDLRRTRTLQISNLIQSTNGHYQTHYSINGWDNQVPQQDN